jgi:hypothetical protein
MRITIGLSWSGIARAAAVAICAIAFGSPAQAERRIALVIGNSAYQHAPRLANPNNDSLDVGERLKALGFTLYGGQDLDRAAVLSQLTAFGRAAETADVALVYYAGHGVQINGQNYLVPVDANVSYEAEADIALVPFNVVMQQLNRGSAVNIAFLDACRDNPFAKELSRTMGTRALGSLGRGLGRTPAVSGSFIAYATQPDNVALDGDGRNSPFTTALLKHIDEPGLSLPDLMIEIRKDVIHATSGKQVPWDSSSLTGRFSFRIEATVEIGTTPSKPAAETPADAKPVDAKTLEFSVWNGIEKSTNPATFEKFLKDFPDGVFASAARERIAGLTAPKSEPVPVPVPQKSRSEACGVAVIDDNFALSKNSAGLPHGLVQIAGPDGGAQFSRKNESRIVYPYARAGLPRSGTLEWKVNVASGYFYSGGKLNPRNACALLFTTDIQNGDVTWPGSAWLYVCDNGDVRFHIAGARYEAGHRPEFKLEAKATPFRYHQWHRIGVSFGNGGRSIMVDGAVVANDADMVQTLAGGGNHQASIDQPTIGESVSGFWPNNQHEGGFEGMVARFRASAAQADWCVAR